MNAAIAIAKHLKVNHWQVTRVEVWPTVFFAVVKGLGARFVSKKVTKMENDNSVNSFGLAEKEQDDRAAKADAMVAELNNYLPMGHLIPWSTLHSAAVDILEGDCTFQEAVDRFTSKKIIKKGSR